jgi:hypothetical protein
MTFGLMRRVAAVAALVAALGVVTTVAASAAGASQPQRRQFAVTTLSDFRVVLTATRTGRHSLMATVTATGYQRSGSHWKPIATTRIGKAGGWFWFSVDTCSLTVTQIKNTKTGNPPAVAYDSAKVSLLITPAIGCSPTYTEHWKP